MDNALPSQIIQIADKINSIFNDCILLQVNNSQIHPNTCDRFLIPLSKGNGKWKLNDKGIKIVNKDSLQNQLKRCVDEHKHEQLADFDNHLDDKRNDWLENKYLLQ